MANVLVVGSGGREHAIAAKFKQSKHVETVYVAPGNPGMCDVATIVPYGVSDFDNLVKFSKENSVDLVFVGPEIPLCEGIVDVFTKEGIAIFGPTKDAARLEGSKVFSKNMMKKYNVPTARYETFDCVQEASEYVESLDYRVVIKADGLAAGKGVIIPETKEEALKALEDMMCNDMFKEAGHNVVVEEYLEGEEFSLLAFVNGETVVGMQLAQDHKRAFDNDEGLNTGGMGAYTPVNHIPQSAYDDALELIIKRMAKGMVQEGCPFTGVLYGGCMLTKDGVKTIEYNVRFGDPETEVVLLAMKNDLYEVITSVMNNETVKLEYDDNTYLGVVLASKGYPDNYAKGFEIKGLENVETAFHMGTSLKDNKCVTNGGRVLFVVGKGKSLKEAQENAYKEVEKISCENLFYRHDIGARGLK